MDSTQITATSSKHPSFIYISLKVLFTCALLIISYTNYAQSNKENDFGFHLGASVYQDFEIKIPAHYYFGTNLEFGLDWIHYYKNDKFWKTGISYSFFRSPYENDRSYYDEYLKIPLLFSIGKLRSFKRNNDLYFTLGPEISILSRQGKINTGEYFYNMDGSQFGSAIKFGFSFELALYQQMIRHTHAGGLRFNFDIPYANYKAKKDLFLYDQYITATLFYSITKRYIRKRQH